MKFYKIMSTLYPLFYFLLLIIPRLLGIIPQVG